MARVLGSYPIGRWFESCCRYHFGPLVKRLRHRPFTAESWVQFPYGSPDSNARKHRLSGIFSFCGVRCGEGNTVRRVLFCLGTHRAETEQFQNRCPEKAAPAERSWRGVLRGHVPSKSLSADSETPCALAFGRTEKVGEKSDSFSRAERTRPLRPCVPLAVLRFWKHSGGMFATDIP